MLLETLGAAALAGLVGSPHCAGMCGGFAAACGQRRGGLALWHAGRLTTYASLGALAGAFGWILPGPGWLPAAASALLLVWFAGALAGVLPEPSPRLGWLGSVGGRLLAEPGLAARFGFGMLNGLLPCGMVYAALSLPLALARPLAGAAVMLAFGAGTLPALTLLPGLLRRAALRGRWQRRAVGALVLAAGLLAVAMRAPARAADPAPAAHAHR